MKFPMVVGVLAVGVRVAAALLQGDAVVPLPGIHDQLSYHALAQRLQQIHELSFGENWWPLTRAGEPTAHWSFLYTALLALFYQLFGVHPIAPRLFQAVLSGLLQPWLTWKIALLFSTRRVATIAALISAGYLYFVYYAGALMTESFFIVAVLWSLYRAANMVSASREVPLNLSDWMGLGFAVGVSCLMRQSFLLFVPFLLLWVFTHTREGGSIPGEPGGWERIKRGRFAGIALCGLTLALMICPFTIRNYMAFGQFVLLNTNAGFAFFWGNHTIHGSRFISILPPEGPSYGQLIPAELRGLDEAALDRALLHRGIRFVLDDPVRFVRLSISRIPALFKFWPSRDSSLPSNIVRTFSFGVLLPFSLCGLILAFCQWRRRMNRGEVERCGSRVGEVLLLFIVIYTSIHLVSWALVRYRLPVDAVLIIFAALGLGHLGGRLGLWPEKELRRV